MKLHLHGVKEDDLSKNMDLSDSGILLCPECKFDTKEENNFEDH